jgi:branched-chain amino acid transport system substrate-binding protein
LLRIKGANPDGLLIYAFAQEAGIIVRQSKELGITAKLFGGGGTSTPLLQRGAGSAAAGFVSDIATQSSRPTSIRRVSTGRPRNRPRRISRGQGDRDGTRKVGKNLSREAFIDALEELKDFDTGVTFPVTYNKDSHEGGMQVEIIRVAPDLKWEVVSKIGGH